MKRALAIALLVAASAIPARAATLVVANCRIADPTTWQAGSWQGLLQGFVRMEESPSSGTWVPCSVVAGDFDDFAAFFSWWTSMLGRPLSEILNAGDLEVRSWLPYSAAHPNPAALLFLQGTGISVPIYPVFDPYDPASVAAAAGELDALWAAALPAWLLDPRAQGLIVEAWLAPTSTLPVPEPGSLGLAGAALAALVFRASRPSRPGAPRAVQASQR